jgi:CRISPR/Cas system CSM-associated protein Csm3 (group 7 of RAMP superfamily)
METKKISYTIAFFSDWHAGSGLSGGAEADALVIKDADNLPFLPGKTIKGLLKDALYDMMAVQPDLIDSNKVDILFGKDTANAQTESDKLFFSNAILPDAVRKEINQDLSTYLYRNISSTSIAKNGVAEQGSLRTIEVTLPIALEGYISGENLDAKDLDLLEKAMKWTRSIGYNRNRGLGRCQIQINA